MIDPVTHHPTPTPPRRLLLLRRWLRYLTAVTADGWAVHLILLRRCPGYGHALANLAADLVRQTTRRGLLDALFTGLLGVCAALRRGLHRPAPGQDTRPLP